MSCCSSPTEKKGPIASIATAARIFAKFTETLFPRSNALPPSFPVTITPRIGKTGSVIKNPNMDFKKLLPLYTPR